jgi:uncharacterized membrane protein
MICFNRSTKHQEGYSINNKRFGLYVSYVLLVVLEGLVVVPCFVESFTPSSHIKQYTTRMNQYPKVQYRQQQRTNNYNIVMQQQQKSMDNNNKNTKEDESTINVDVIPSNQMQQQYICDMDDTIQQLTFIVSFVLLGLGTYTCIQLWYHTLLPMVGIEYFVQIQTVIFPLLFGTIFALVGICHFIFVQNFVRIVPSYNTWGGLWKIPAPFHTKFNISYEEYHSYWTGIVEFIGGIWLFYTGWNHQSIDTSSIVPATILFLLTIIVTPANIYMFTHNASPGGIIPPLSYPYGHFLRFILQCGLLSNFYIMMHPITTTAIM